MCFCDKTGCCGTFSRCLLVFFNIVLFICSLLSLILTILIRSISRFFSYTVDEEEFTYLIKLVDPFLITIIVIALILIIVSAYGFSIGCCIHKIAVIVYLCIIGIIFIGNIIAFIVLIVSFPEKVETVEEQNVLNAIRTYGVIIPNSVLLAFEAILILLAIACLLSILKKENENQVEINLVSQRQVSPENLNQPKKEEIINEKVEPSKYNNIYPQIKQ